AGQRLGQSNTGFTTVGERDPHSAPFALAPFPFRFVLAELPAAVRDDAPGRRHGLAHLAVRRELVVFLPALSRHDPDYGSGARSPSLPAAADGGYDAPSERPSAEASVAVMEVTVVQAYI